MPGSSSPVRGENMARKDESGRLPPLRRPDSKVTDPGKVRLGDGVITAEFPPLRRPDEQIADPGRDHRRISTQAVAFSASPRLLEQ
jgi:hypothetical protein